MPLQHRVAVSVVSAVARMAANLNESERSQSSQISRHPHTYREPNRFESSDITDQCARGEGLLSMNARYVSPSTQSPRSHFCSP